MPTPPTSYSEHQRILNVLAQRRYRQRQRERLRSLESQVARAGSAGVPEPQAQLQLPSPSFVPVASVPSFLPQSCPSTLKPTVGAPEVEYSSWSAWQNEPTPDGMQFFGNNDSVANLLQVDNNVSYGAQPLTPMPHVIDELQDLERSQSTLLAENKFELPTLRLMEASLQIAQIFGCANEIMDLSANRVFDLSKLTIPLIDIPENLRPTDIQLFVPHHPVLDILPWPSVRTKLICLFNQPDHLRPQIARGPNAVMALVHGFEDESEGLRISSAGDGPVHDWRVWEIGEVVFKDWWWALDSQIVSNSNRLRQMRGVPKLQLS
ncbi:hypothetical protein DL95DRAFT_452520 [Leptodontidium sp. 2 PMI_412]|nr:hypothetical protein DL95DRAFT_452520 [Leptodontidium sp. 2 PMI_412]